MAETNCTGTCPKCGNSFVRVVSHGPKRVNYCSEKCRRAHKAKARALRLRDTNKPGSMAARRDFICLGCGQRSGRKIGDKDAGKYCSMACYHAGLAAAKAVKAAAKEAAKALNMEVMALRRIARYIEKPKALRIECACCGASMGIVGRLSTRGKKRVCQACQKTRARNYKRTPIGRAIKKKHKTLRRMRIGAKAEAIDPIAVFERDKWTCRLCGVKTPKKLRGTNEATAPELDHIIPLALGGGHVWHNVQCSCRKCNGEKGATIKGQFLLCV